MILAHASSEPHLPLSALLAVLALGIAIGACLGLALARRGRD